ncbi:MAG: hypothetical protein ACK47B_05230 [Armatimonadota bacterium]
MTEAPVTTPPPQQRETMMPISGNRRLLLAPEGLVLEVRSGSYWARARVIPYADIRAAYQYEVRDWGPLGASIGFIACVGFVVLMLLAFEAIGTGVAGLALAVSAVLLLGIGFYRSLTVPRRLLRIEAYSGPMVLPNRGNFFFPALAERLPKPPAAAPAPPAEPSPEPADQPAWGGSSQSGSSGESPLS